MEQEGDVVALPCGHPYLLGGSDDSASVIICSVCNTPYAEEHSHEDILPELDLEEVREEDLNVILNVTVGSWNECG